MFRSHPRPSLWRAAVLLASAAVCVDLVCATDASPVYIELFDSLHQPNSFGIPVTTNDPIQGRAALPITCPAGSAAVTVESTELAASIPAPFKSISAWMRVDSVDADTSGDDLVFYPKVRLINVQGTPIPAAVLVPKVDAAAQLVTHVHQTTLSTPIPFGEWFWSVFEIAHTEYDPNGAPYKVETNGLARTYSQTGALLGASGPSTWLLTNVNFTGHANGVDFHCSQGFQGAVDYMVLSSGSQNFTAPADLPDWTPAPSTGTAVQIEEPGKSLRFPRGAELWQDEDSGALATNQDLLVRNQNLLELVETLQADVALLQEQVGTLMAQGA